MNSEIIYAPDKADVKFFDEPLRWVCNEFYHDAKRRRKTFLTDTIEDDALHALGYGLWGGIALSQVVKFTSFDTFKNVSESALRTIDIPANVSLDHAIVTGLSISAIFGYWYFSGSKERREYAQNHPVYSSGVRGTLTGAATAAIFELMVRNPNFLQVFSYLD